ncbi:MAG TPA: ORF6N domain-containing protein [Bacteroidia bacterium]|nr:ORF6N domain-containing protein [Bacteroidia bacterium]
MKTGTEEQLPDDLLQKRIYFIRGQKVMIDRDLAALYGVPTKALKQAVKRNLARFPPDFMFVMTAKELENWRSQIVTSNSEKMGLRHKPFCFTEHGVTMLSCVLSSERAIAVNIRIIRVFIRMREAVTDSREMRLKLELLEKEVGKNSADIKSVFAALRQLFDPDRPPRKQIGYKNGER